MIFIMTSIGHVARRRSGRVPIGVAMPIGQALDVRLWQILLQKSVEVGVDR